MYVFVKADGRDSKKKLNIGHIIFKQPMKSTLRLIKLLEFTGY